MMPLLWISPCSTHLPLLHWKAYVIGHFVFPYSRRLKLLCMLNCFNSFNVWHSSTEQLLLGSLFNDYLLSALGETSVNHGIFLSFEKCEVVQTTIKCIYKFQLSWWWLSGIWHVQYCMSSHLINQNILTEVFLLS
jgi:hypothetical protein